MTSADALPGVSRTALGVARVRARESARDDRLFEDPLAGLFVAAAAGEPGSEEGAAAGAGNPLGAALAFQIVVRTRFFDDHLLDACAAGCRQVVLVAAGLDSRAFRLDWPDGVRLFEVDLPEVLAFKDAVLAEHRVRPRCERHAVAADLREDWAAALAAAGFDPGRATAWLSEGLLIYLGAADAAAVLAAVEARSAPGSRVALESGGGHAWLRAQAETTPGAGHLASLWQGGLGDDPADWLRARGWETTTHSLAALAAGYGRPARSASQSGFVTATRQPGG
ncbi:MAG: SAM-dependent methyltransferase [Chloroflexi bacterium]|nr:MAG: SAM-dependent methyltransferase [Chloroflexota bacterium]